MKNKKTIKESVKEAYGKIARAQGGCGCGPAGACGTDTGQFAKSIGYTAEELNNIPKEANLGLSCGNPTTLASLKKGDVVLDLGSGAGFDCFLAAARVGKEGSIIGIDMTPDMIKKAKDNAKKNVFHVSFRSSKTADVNKIAAFFGGGGHKKASGCTLKGPFGEVKRKILKKINDEI